MTGYKCGNTLQPGCLTNDTNVRLHSCERGVHCPVVLNENTVWIKPVVTRTQVGEEIEEMGIGGGGGDLTEHQELEVDNAIIHQLLGLFPKMAEPIMQDIKQAFQAGLQSSRQAISLDELGIGAGESDLSLAQFTKAFAKTLSEKHNIDHIKNRGPQGDDQELPKVITFPYSRHSSYPELCDLVRIFQPKDVYPCTVHERSWHECMFISIWHVQNSN